MEFSLVDYTGALALFTALLFWVTYRSLREQGNYYKATTRPFVNIKEMDPKPLDLQIQNDVATVKFEINNYGNTPSKDVQCKAEIFSKENPEHKIVFNEEDEIYSIYPDDSIIDRRTFTSNL